MAGSSAAVSFQMLDAALLVHETSENKVMSEAQVRLLVARSMSFIVSSIAWYKSSIFL
jgi:hypothetical protein